MASHEGRPLGEVPPGWTDFTSEKVKKKVNKYLQERNQAPAPALTVKPDVADHPNRQVHRDRFVSREIRDRQGNYQGEKALSLRTHNAEDRQRSFTDNPISKRRNLREISGGELEGY